MPFVLKQHFWNVFSNLLSCKDAQSQLGSLSTASLRAEYGRRIHAHTRAKTHYKAAATRIAQQNLDSPELIDVELIQRAT
ncbi:MAG: hypothetical protein CMM01_20980 [Rhodopirellula sp.]|nr:hypothetical protein [Rhodopirellula sp.]